MTGHRMGRPRSAANMTPRGGLDELRGHRDRGETGAQERSLPGLPHLDDSRSDRLRRGRELRLCGPDLRPNHHDWRMLSDARRRNSMEGGTRAGYSPAPNRPRGQLVPPRNRLVSIPSAWEDTRAPPPARSSTPTVCASTTISRARAPAGAAARPARRAFA